jgi:anion transporter
MTTTASRSPSVATPWLRWALAVGVWVAVRALAPAAGLSPLARAVVPIAAFTMTLWILQPVSAAIASILMLALMIVAGVPPTLALSGFSSPQFWILLAVLYFGFAMQKTHLARRLAFHILRRFPATYGGILGAFFVMGLVLALGIPSMTVRTAIMVPIAWALVGALGLEPHSRGAALIIISAIEMAVVPGLAFLYGALFGPVVASLFAAKGLPLSWFGYAQVMTVPIVTLSVCILVVNRLAMQPESAIDASAQFARDQLAALGRIKGVELVTALVVCSSIVLWATDRYHHIPAYVIGMLALTAFGMAGIIRDGDISAGVPWSLLLFLGGIFSLGSIIQEYKITDWLAGFFVPTVQQLTASPVAFLIAMSLAMFALRFLDPPGFIALTVLFLGVVDLAARAGVPPLVLVAALLFASAPFWATYQNIWVAMGDGLTGGQGFTSRQRVTLATAYALVSLVTLVGAVWYWKLVGVLG